MRGQVACRTEPLRDVNSITSSSIQRLSCEVRQGNFTFRCCVFSTVKWGQGHLFPRACVRAKLLQSCLTLWDPVHCSQPGSSVHGILRARISAWIAYAFLQGIFPTQGLNPRLSSPALAGKFFTSDTTWEAYFPGRETQTTIFMIHTPGNLRLWPRFPARNTLSQRTPAFLSLSRVGCVPQSPPSPQQHQSPPSQCALGRPHVPLPTAAPANHRLEFQPPPPRGLGESEPVISAGKSWQLLLFPNRRSHKGPTGGSTT